jgi:stage V sporulation protein G
MNRISEVQIQVVKPRNGLIGFASCVLDDVIYLSSIGIFSKLDGTGYRLTYPTKVIGDQSLQIFHPINREITQEIEKAIFTKLENLMEKEAFNNAF